MDISQKIHALRLEQHKTLDDIAKAVGVSKSTVSKWESGYISNMRRDKIAKLALALDTTPEYLLGWDESTPPPAPAPLSPDEEQLLDDYRLLNQGGKEYILQTMAMARQIYTEKNAVSDVEKAN